MSLFDKIKKDLNYLGIRPDRRFSQNFLTDENVIFDLMMIAKKNGLSENIVEIGCGTGVLTEELLKLTKKNFYGIEVDKRMQELLTNKFSQLENFHLIKNDVLRVDFKDILTDQKHTLFGNLPYQITSAIIRKACEDYPLFDKAYFLVQKEVGERLVSGPGTKEYGVLSIAAQVYSDVKYLFTVPSAAFYPAPKVDSAFIEFDFSNQKYLSKIKDERKFFKIVKLAFSQRRKTLRNNLKGLYDSALYENNIDPMRRAETLSIDEFILLTDLL